MSTWPIDFEDFVEEIVFVNVVDGEYKYHLGLSKEQWLAFYEPIRKSIESMIDFYDEDSQQYSWRDNADHYIGIIETEIVEYYIGLIRRTSES